MGERVFTRCSLVVTCDDCGLGMTFLGASAFEARNKARASGWRFRKRDSCPACYERLKQEALAKRLARKTKTGTGTPAS